MDEKKYLDYDNKTNEVKEVDNETTNNYEDFDIEEDHKLNNLSVADEELSEYQVKKAINSDLDEVKYRDMIDDIYEDEKDQLEKRYLSKEESINEDFGFKVKKEKKEKRKRRPIGSFFKRAEKKEKKANILELVKKIFSKFIILVIFVLLIAITFKTIFKDENTSVDIDKSLHQEQIDEVNKAEFVPKKDKKVENNILSSFIKYLDRCDQVMDAMLVVVAEENDVFIKYANSELERTQVINFYQQTLSKKEQLDLLLEEGTVYSEYASLYDITKKRLRESTNSTKNTLYNFNNFKKRDVLQSDISRYIQLDLDLVEKQQEVLIDLFKSFNIKYKLQDGELLYDITSVANKK